ncbi:AMP-binding enzyme [Penicillium soppii]|uniref:AMP-binding enzyme n=1 Tax=Penicillium soppii TaxID=69789 RepID=UPI00254740F6|nr:AMP-binding enzyme [Penicillium soppii]KAJ5852655.1 AMP-binding enzyme [Penicillium soppii]
MILGLFPTHRGLWPWLMLWWQPQMPKNNSSTTLPEKGCTGRYHLCTCLVGMVLLLSMTTYVDTTLVIGPALPPDPNTVIDILKYGKVGVALLTPAIIEEFCLTTTGTDALRKLESVHYAGAPLSAKTGNLLVSHTLVIPTIGIFEHRFDNLHELVFVRKLDSNLQSIFQLYPDFFRYPTSDLWIEHPVHKGLWEIIGRSDDYVTFSHGKGQHASRLEPGIEAHPEIKSTLISGHGEAAPGHLVELHRDLVDTDGRDQLIVSLQPNIKKFNAHVHDCVNLSADRIIIVTKEKPFTRTI